MIELNTNGSVGEEARSSQTIFLLIFPSIMLPMFLAMVDQTIVATALPAIAGDLGSVERVSWVIVSYLIATTIAAPVYGRLGDVLGRRRVMYFALALFVIASALCAVSPSIEILSLMRFLQGLGGGGLMTSSQALIGETIPPRERARYQGYLAAVAVCASAFGPVAGGYLTEHLGWQSVFLVNLPLGLLAAVLLMRLPASAGSTEALHFDVSGLALFICFVAPALIALEQIQHFDPHSLSLALGLAGIAIASALLLVRREQRAPSPLLPVALLTRPAIWRSDALAACHGATLVALLTFMPLYLRVVHGSSPSETGLFLLPLTAGIGIGSMVTGRLISKTGLTTIFPSIGLIVVVMTLLTLAVWAPALTIFGVVALFAVNSIFMGTVMGVVQVTVQSAAGPEMIGTAAGSVQFSRSLGAAFGTSVVATVLFVTLARKDPDTARLFGAMMETGPGAIANLTPARQAAIQSEVGDAFQAAFLTIAGFAACALAFAWWIPLRRL
jgi:EmrB/QacA subfamily drug resistance transporter